MGIRFTKEVVERINKSFSEKRPCSKLKIDYGSSTNCETIYNGIWSIVEITELDTMINDLIAMQDVLRDEAGIIC